MKANLSVKRDELARPVNSTVRGLEAHPNR